MDLRYWLTAPLLIAFLLAFGLAPHAVQAQTPTTTIQNGNADTRLQLNYDGGLYVPGIFGPTTPADSIPASGAGTRLMWYPAKGAFRAGRVGRNLDGTQWDASKSGDYSVAMGVDTKASAEASVAMGDASTAIDRGAVAMGVTSDAEGSSAVAMGKSSTATGEFAVAIGRQVSAEGQSAVALGGFTDATADAAIALGGTASGVGATSMNNAEASGRNAVAMGQNTTASAARSVSMGRYTTAATPQSLSTGVCNSANTNDDNTLFVVGSGTFDSDNFECSSRDDAFTVDEGGSATASSHDTFSDRRLKTGVEPLSEDVLQALQEIEPVRYRFKNESTHASGKQIGLIAQDVRKEFPELVRKGSGGYLSLAYPKMTALLLKGLQEQQAQIRALKSENDRIRAQNEELEKRVGQIEDLKKRLAVLERQNASSLPAGWGPAALLILLVGGGSFGAGLLWRRRN